MNVKLDRLLAITMTLINRKRIQAKDLAEMFDVSVRTIYRDIEALSLAGIPITTFQGKDGGIGIIDGYRMDKNMLTNDEFASIVSALKTVSSYSDTHMETVLDKIQGIIPERESELFRAKTEQVFVDLSPWDNDLYLKNKINILKSAIQSFHSVSFVYCNAKGEASERSVDPYTLILKGQQWYLYSYCHLKNAFRLFKLSRMREIVVIDKIYHRSVINLEEIPWQKEWNNSRNTIQLVLKFDEGVRVFIEERFGVENIIYAANGSCIVKASFPEDEWIYGFILSFGHRVEVLEPEHVRIKVNEIAGRIQEIYGRENF